MRFKGIQKTTLIDFPGRIACTLFLGGCDFRCAYCYNPDLVLDRETGINLSEEEILSFLKERASFLDGVCVTGGEPFRHQGLLGFLQKVKNLGYQVKVDTNGFYPQALKEAVASKVVDYLAMDIKASPNKYDVVVRTIGAFTRIEESAKIVKESSISYEFRTTVFSGLTLEDFEAIGRWLLGGRKYCLQTVKTNVPLLDPSFASQNSSPSYEYLQEIASRLTSYFDQVEIRN